MIGFTSVPNFLSVVTPSVFHRFGESWVAGAVFLRHIPVNRVQPKAQQTSTQMNSVSKTLTSQRDCESETNCSFTSCTNAASELVPQFKDLRKFEAVFCYTGENDFP
jgi:hypothetical protein